MIKQIKILTVGIVASSLLTGCVGLYKNDYSAYGIDRDDSKNIIKSKEVILNSEADMKKYIEINQNVIRKLNKKQIEGAYYKLDSIESPALDENGNEILNSEGKPLMITKQGIGRADDITQSFKIFKGNGGEILFSGKSKERVVGKETLIVGNGNGGMRDIEYNTVRNSSIKYSLKPILKGNVISDLKQIVITKCDFRDRQGKEQEFDCVNKNDFYTKSFLRTISEMQTILKNSYSQEMEKEVLKAGLKLKN